MMIDNKQRAIVLRFDQLRLVRIVLYASSKDLPDISSL